METIDKHNFLIYLKKHYPHLFHFQAEIEKVFNETGFGDATASATIRRKKVFSCDVAHWVKNLYENKS